MESLIKDLVKETLHRALKGQENGQEGAYIPKIIKEENAIVTAPNGEFDCETNELVADMLTSEEQIEDYCAFLDTLASKSNSRYVEEALYLSIYRYLQRQGLVSETVVNSSPKLKGVGVNSGSDYGFVLKSLAEKEYVDYSYGTLENIKQYSRLPMPKCSVKVNKDVFDTKSPYLFKMAKRGEGVPEGGSVRAKISSSGEVVLTIQKVDKESFDKFFEKTKEIIQNMQISAEERQLKLSQIEFLEKFFNDYQLLRMNSPYFESFQQKAFGIIADLYHLTYNTKSQRHQQSTDEVIFDIDPRKFKVNTNYDENLTTVISKRDKEDEIEISRTRNGGVVSYLIRCKDNKSINNALASGDQNGVEIETESAENE